MNAVTGAVAETCTSLPWGDNLQCTGADQSPLHFTGKQRDSESGLDNFDVRYFGPSFGRFMRPDPDNAGARLENPQSWNAYLYVLNNPLIFSDPFGLDCIYTPGASGNPNPREDGHATIVPGDCINAGGKDDGGVFVDNNKDNPVQQSDITLSQDGSVGVVAYTPANGVGMAYSCIGNCPSDTVQVNAAPPGTPTMSVAPLPDNLQPQTPPLQLSQQRTKSYTDFVGCEVNQDIANVDPEPAPKKNIFVIANTAPLIFAGRGNVTGTITALLTAGVVDVGYVSKNRETCVHSVYGPAYF